MAAAAQLMHRGVAIILVLLLTIGLACRSAGAATELQQAPQEKVADKDRNESPKTGMASVDGTPLPVASVDGVPRPSEISRGRRRAGGGTVRCAGM